MPKAVIDQLKENSEKALGFLRASLQGIRTGRAHPGLVSDIKVDYFGTPTPIKNMGSINVPEARQLVIVPWDKTALKAIEKAIQASSLGINPQNDGESIRLNMPELTHERRVELNKIVNKTAEDARIGVRNARRDAIEKLKKMEKDSEITEDEQHKAEEDMQKITDKAIKDCDAIYAAKEKEIMEV